MTKNEIAYDAYVIEYLQTPMMFDFYHKKVNKKQFLKEEEWHCDTVYFQFVPLNFDFDAWQEVIRKSSVAHDFAYNLGQREKDGSWFFVNGKKRYLVGKVYTRQALQVFTDNKYFQSALNIYPEFNRFCITEKGGNNYVVPMYNEDECVHDTGKKAERYKSEQEESKCRKEESAKKKAVDKKKKKISSKPVSTKKPMTMEVKVVFSNIIWEDFDDSDPNYPGTEFIQTLSFFIRNNDTLEGTFRWHLQTRYDHDIEHFDYKVLSMKFSGGDFLI